MLSIVNINVGGISFVTTTETLRPLSKLIKRLEATSPTVSGAIFFDRDSATFAKILKLLRGYPCRAYMTDPDVIHDLIYWKHDMLKIEIPNWLHPQIQATHTLDPHQKDTYGTTHSLMALTTIDRLLLNGFINGTQFDYPICNPVGAPQNWVDSAWVSKDVIETALIRYRFASYFNFIKA